MRYLFLVMFVVVTACAPVHQTAPQPMAISPVSPEPAVPAHSRSHLQKKVIDQRLGEAQDELRALKDGLASPP